MIFNKNEQNLFGGASVEAPETYGAPATENAETEDNGTKIGNKSKNDGESAIDFKTIGCRLCPNECGVNRDLEKGKCGESNKMRIAKYYLHPFEEPFISGKNGSGTVFFSGCGLKCVFCQNYELSRSKRGKEITPNELSDIFKELENAGAHDINLVNPTHFATQIYEAIKIRRPNIPVVYNTHGYESERSLDVALKFSDVFLPDLKYYSPEVSQRYANCNNYFAVAEKAIKRMMRERKTVIENDLMQSGVCVRHLILPLNLADTRKIIEWFAKNQENGAYFSLMAQYTPFGEIDKFPELKRKITAREYNAGVEKIFEENIKNCIIQKRESASECFIPKWDF